MLQIHQQRFELLPLPYFTAPLLKDRHIAEFPACSPFGLIARHAIAHQFVYALVEVLLNRNRDVVEPTLPCEEADKEMTEPRHSTPPMPGLRQAHEQSLQTSSRNWRPLLRDGGFRYL